MEKHERHTMVIVPEEEWSEMDERVKRIEDMLLLLTDKKQKKDEWLSSTEARKILGVSEGTWQTYRNRSIIPFSQIGRKIRVKRSDIDTFLAKHYISTD